MDALKFAIAGAGYIADIHARALQAHKDVQLVAVVEKFTRKSNAFARKFSLPCQYKTVQELLTDVQIDALVIGTPNYLHAPQAIQALEAGVHVLVEKPMAMRAAECEAMLVASKKSGAHLMVAHCFRFDQDVLWLKTQIARLGRIVRTKGYGVHVHWGPGGWFTKKQFAGGGAMADMGIHALDTARFLLGDPQPVSVFARLGTYYQDFNVDDTGVIIVTWDNGAVSYIESGWWQPYADGPQAATQLYGTRGFGQVFPTRLIIPKPASDGLEVIDPGFVFPRPEQCPQEMYNAQMRHFIDCIQQNVTPVPGGEEGFINMKVVDAAYESSRTGNSVEITS